MFVTFTLVVIDIYTIQLIIETTILNFYISVLSTSTSPR